MKTAHSKKCCHKAVIKTHRFQKSGHAGLARFAREEDGAMVIFGVYVFLMMLLIVGIGIDIMHLERERTKLQGALDNALLAAADLDQELDPATVAQDYFKKSGVNASLANLEVVGNQNYRSVSADAVTQFKTQFMHMLGLDYLNAPAAATAAEAVPKTEISMVMDISGSMKHNVREQTMKEASKEFVTKVLSRNIENEEPLVSVNVVPFAGQTNPGPDMFEYLEGDRFGTTGEDYFPEWQQDISNIVFWYDTDNDGEVDYSVKIEDYPDNDVEMFNKDDLDSYLPYVLDYIHRQNPALTEDSAMFLGASIKGGLQTTEFFSVAGDDVTGSTKFNKTDLSFNFGEFYDQIVPDAHLFDAFYSDIIPNNVSSCIEMTEEDFGRTTLPEGSDDQVGHFAKWTYDGTEQDWGWCPEDDTAIQYAQKDADALNTFIDSLRLHDGTGTNYAMKYAAALLDPSTQPAFEFLSDRGAVPATFVNRPAAWTDTDTAKYIVLLTDGEITGQDRPADELDPLNAVEELSDRPVTDSVSTSDRSVNLSLFHQQCQIAKDNGVIVYTVAFEAPTSVHDDLQTCASSDAHFFNVTGAELVDAFVAIASSIQRLRLTQ